MPITRVRPGRVPSANHVDPADQEVVDDMDEVGMISRVTAGTTLVLRMAGELDLSTVPESERELLAIGAAVAPPRRVVLDLTSVRFLSAAGLRLLLGFTARCADHGVPVHLVVEPTGVVHRVLRLARTHERVLVFRSVADAIAGGDTDPDMRSRDADVLDPEAN